MEGGKLILDTEYAPECSASKLAERLFGATAPRASLVDLGIGQHTFSYEGSMAPFGSITEKNASMLRATLLRRNEL
jgi:hypothetical protein